jgi:hypothetical protein
MRISGLGLMALVLVGCGGKERDDRLSALEASISDSSAQQRTWLPRKTSFKLTWTLCVRVLMDSIPLKPVFSLRKLMPSMRAFSRPQQTSPVVWKHSKPKRKGWPVV